ncbi:MAG: cupin domain-containing protein [candidate division Zixibacteria bacterium]|nr:cupin domain-containing protein [candidate division Zixibacteria bacterium]
MITIRQSDDRGHVNHGWLDTYHTFSFDRYYDPKQMGFRDLRVINEDRVAPGMGFGRHPHHDMEIITYVLSGELEHQDSMGHRSTITPGEVQRMTAGSGIEHSEKNASDTSEVHLLQIWILPRERGLEPNYGQTYVPVEERQGQLRLIAGPDPQLGDMQIQQDVSLYATVLDTGQSVTHHLQPNRHAWIQVARGTITVNGTELSAGDGAAVSDETQLVLHARDSAEVLLFDLN